MRIETIPLIIGLLVALVGLGLVADAWIPEDVPGFRERRRRQRTERHLGGEAAIGLGVLADRNLLPTTAGQAVLSVALLQDVAAIPILALVPLLAATSVPAGGAWRCCWSPT